MFAVGPSERVANLYVSYAACDESEEDKAVRGRFNEDDKIGLARGNNVQSHYAFS
jgi:hypothetical protein